MIFHKSIVTQSKFCLKIFFFFNLFFYMLHTHALMIVIFLTQVDRIDQKLEELSASQASIVSMLHRALEHLDLNAKQ